MGYRESDKDPEDRRATYAGQSRRTPVRDPWSDRGLPCTPKDVRALGRAAEVPGECVWAAEIGGRLVGLIGVVPGGEHVARIQWFRIEPDWQHTTVLAKLIGQLYEHCCRHGYARVVLDARVAPQWMWRLFVRRGFRLLRRVRGPRSEMLEFGLEPCAQGK